jgi:hypothetical protein
VEGGRKGKRERVSESESALARAGTYLLCSWLAKSALQQAWGW